MLHNFVIQDNKIQIGGINAEDLVRQYGSPLYVYDADTIKKRYADLAHNITHPRVEFYYACKQNPNIELIKLLKNEGAKIETVSKKEAQIALEAGFTPEEIIYTCSYITKQELEFVIENGIMANLDSLTQIERFGEIKPGGNISIRINQGIGGGHHAHTITGGPDSKFGIDISQIDEAKRVAKQYGLRITGIHQHIGSGILDDEIIIRAIKTLLGTAKQFPDLDFIDFGGGFGIAYRPEDQPLNMQLLGARITEELERFTNTYGKELRMLFEPGRFLVGESGVLLATVTDIKKTPHHIFVGVDSGFNHLVRPIMYGSYHEIVNASCVNGDEETVWVAGNICESGDIFARDRRVTKLSEGDIVAILDAGASGYAMSFDYNGRGQPPEVLVDNGKARLISKV